MHSTLLLTAAALALGTVACAAAAASSDDPAAYGKELARTIAARRGAPSRPDAPVTTSNSRSRSDTRITPRAHS